MKLALTIVLLGAAVFRLSAEEATQAPDPDTVFRLALQKIEHDFVAGMRQLTAKAAEVRVYRIGELKPDWGPFSTAPEGTVFTMQADGDDLAYTVLKAVAPITKEEVIRLWAQTVLPGQPHPFAMCMPTPGFAIRFLDSNGKSIYSTAICLKCQSASMEFPRYSERIGFDPKAMERLLKEAGFSSEDLKAAQGVAPQSATRSESDSEGGDKPQPESGPRPR